ncbi:MAG: hypothetical protein WCI46_07605 [Verrucomicrobiota bacterium]
MALTPDTAEQVFLRAHAEDRLAHAYLITGPSGVGKVDLARKLSRLILCQPSGDPFAHADFHRIEPESKSRRIVIEQVRELEQALQMRSLFGGKKVGMILDAERLQPQAANAFLKTLEEPPAGTHLLLISSQPEQILETILSRCLEVPLQRMIPRVQTAQEQQLLQYLSACARTPKPQISEVFGLVRDFQSLLTEGKKHIVEETEAALKADEKHYKQTSDSGKWLDDREDYYKALTEARYIGLRSDLLSTFENWWADALRQQHGSMELDLPDFASATATLATRHTTAELLRKSSALELLRDNLNRSGVQESLAIECAFLVAFS